MKTKKIKKPDQVTGLPYYNEFTELAEHELKKGKLEAGQTYMLIASDISNFRYINRLYGIEKGNRLLSSFAQFYAFSEDAHCIVSCRPYSDHIIGLYTNVADREEFKRIVNEGIEKFVASVKPEFPHVALHIHTGIYVIRDINEPIACCIDKANIARKSVKGNYRVNCAYFEEDMQEKKDESAKILSLFDKALEEDRVRVFLQPKIRITNHELEGAEALARMFDEDGKMVSPGMFVPALEKCGKVLELDRYITKKVFSLLAQWQAEGVRMIPVSVNISRINFYNENLVEEIVTEFQKYSIPPKYVEFEITESAFFEEQNLITEKVKALRGFGFHVSMDDFGTGYSTIYTLGALPVDVVKLDRGFVQNSLKNPSGLKIMAGLIDIFKQIELGVICEGVETREEENIVLECGCDSVQGYLYDKPLAVSDFEGKYIKNDNG